MKTAVMLAGALCLAAVSTGQALEAPGEVVVWFADEDSTAIIITDSTITSTYPCAQNVFEQYNLLSAHPLFGPSSVLRQAYVLIFATESSLDSLVSAFEGCGCVREAVKNTIGEVDYSGPNDYAYNHDYLEIGHPIEDGRLDEWHLPAMQADRAWVITRGSDDVIVAVLDVGVDYEHPDLDAQIWVNVDEDINSNGVFDNYSSASGGDLDGSDNDGNGVVDDVVGYDFYYWDSDPQTDENGAHGSHGTVMSSIIASEVNNDSLGAVGVAWHATIMPVKVGTRTFMNIPSAVLAGINYAIDNGADIVNMSFGQGTSSGLQTVIERGDSAGVVFVASAGNNAVEGVNGIASYPQVICVGAAFATGYKDFESNYGSAVDICAPSADGAFNGIVTCTYNASPPYYPPCPGDSSPHKFWYSELQTSGAAAEVSGVLALLKARYPNATPGVLKADLYRGAAPLLDPLYSQGKLGAGMVNPFRSLTEWGVISTNTTWSDTVYVSGDIRVAAGVTLTIEPGAVVNVWPDDVNYAINTAPDGADSLRIEVWVDGTINAVGTSGAPITMRAFDNNGTTTDNDAWFGVFVTSTGGADFRYCNIQNARYGIQTNADISVRNCNIRYAEKRGISVAYTDSVYVADTTIRDVAEFGVNIVQSSTVRIVRSTIRDVGIHGLQVLSGSTAYIDTVVFREDSIGVYLFRDSYPPAVTALVHGCSFLQNDSGVWQNGSAGLDVAYCVIDSNSTNGIYILGPATADIRHNLIRYNGNGVHLYQNANPKIENENVIESNAAGIVCDGSSPRVRRNKIVSNGVGVSCLNDGDPDLGHWCGSPCDTSSCTEAGKNNISENDQHVASLSVGVTIAAECNYWGSTRGPKPTKFVGSVDYSPYLTSNPVPGLLVAAEPSLRDEGTGKPSLPAEYSLSQNRPNPFNPTTMIRFGVPSPGGMVKLVIYDVAGRQVATIASGQHAPGFYDVIWGGRDERSNPAASGIYFARLETPMGVQTRKIVLLK